MYYKHDDNGNVPKFRTIRHNSGSSTILEQFKHSRILNPHDSLNIVRL